MARPWRRWSSTRATTATSTRSSPCSVYRRGARAIVALRFYDDLSEAAIAEALGIRPGTVKSQLARGLEQLRGELGSLEGT